MTDKAYSGDYIQINNEVKSDNEPYVGQVYQVNFRASDMGAVGEDDTIQTTKGLVFKDYEYDVIEGDTFQRNNELIYKSTKLSIDYNMSSVDKAVLVEDPIIVQKESEWGDDGIITLQLKEAEWLRDNLDKYIKELKQKINDVPKIHGYNID